MKNTMKNIIQAIAVTLLLSTVGCSKVEKTGAVDGNKVFMTVKVSQRDTKASPITSVEDFRTRYADTGIAVWAFFDGFSSENKLFSGEVFKYDSGNGYWTASIPREWPSADELGYGVIAGALAPAGCSYKYIEPLGFSYTLPHDIRDQVDFYRGLNTGTKAAQLELEFYPCLCPVHFEIGSMPEGYHVTQISISGAYDYYEYLPDDSYTYDFTNYAVKDDSPFTITKGVHFNTDAEIPSCVFYMLPYVETGNEKATVTVESEDGIETFTADVDILKNGKSVWRENHNVTYTLNFVRHLDSFTLDGLEGISDDGTQNGWIEADDFKLDPIFY